MLTTIRETVRRYVQNAHDRGSCHGKARKLWARRCHIVYDFHRKIAVSGGIQQMLNIHPADNMATGISLHDVDNIKAGNTTGKWITATG